MRKRSPTRAAASPTEPLEASAAEAPSERLSPVGERLLRVAEGASLDALPALQSGDVPPQLSEFIQIYREWITLERGALGTQQQQADQWQMLMHCMVNGTTIEDAVGLLLRFSKVVWGDRAPSELRDEGDVAALVFQEPHRLGSEGLIAVLWILALTLCELEFLANARFDGVRGRVIHEPCLSEGVARLLFSAPISHGEKEAALLIPKRHLRRAVVARAGDLPEFFRQLMPLTLGAKRGRPGMQTMVAGLIRDDKRGPVFHETSRRNVAARLGVSETTLRRRLGEEGRSFRQIKEGIYNELAQAWLKSGDASIDEIAGRLDFSDGFAFRRFFRRLNGCSPSAFRARG